MKYNIKIIMDDDRPKVLKYKLINSADSQLLAKKNVSINLLVASLRCIVGQIKISFTGNTGVPYQSFRERRII